MLFLAGGFFFLNVLNFSVCGFVSGGGGDVVWVRGVGGVGGGGASLVVVSRTSLSILIFWGFFKMLTAIISFFVYFVGFHYDFCIFYSRKRKCFLFIPFFSKCLETLSLP